ncbi:MFS general substrate transporter [Aspergillus piperis CBS 112811]|uniref:MFS general substrate transporter n=1 Tax=Aspergillus piperis CBS 112811 TaxID=1448313 RepID=A0A8G1R749_9EURO|nr:MFS general substrate transporter [Aspergillus piperis CBS 112811]RAH58935.1 MFS general substrate transporter [Aspergillus piperis CBS 112811]
MSDIKKAEVSMGDVEVGVGYNRPIGFADLAHHKIKLDDARRSNALKILAEQRIVIDVASPAAKKVLRRIDMRIMPLVLGLYTLQLLDKNSLSYAALMGIKEDTRLTGNQYDWLGSIVYFGYLFGEIPAAFLMQRVPMAKYLGVMSVLWGTVVTLHAACHNFGGLAAVRFLLGSIEVCTTPAILYVTSSWYSHSEQVTRVAIWYSASGWAQVFGGFFSWAINHATGFKWESLFIFYGGLTFVTGVIIFFLLAASPVDASWLSDNEKAIALERVRANKTGSEMWSFNWYQLKESLCDPRLYLIFLLMVSTGLPNGGLTAFGPTIISGFGFDDNTTTLLSMAPGACAALGTVLVTVVIKCTNRTIGGIFIIVLGCVGVIMMLTIPENANAARYGGYILTMQYPNAILVVLAFITSGVGGSTKKLAFGASYQLGYAVGNICGPQTFRADEAPHYYTAKFTMLAFLVCTAILLASMGIIHWHWNRKRDRQDALDAQRQIVRESVINEEFADLTDFQLRSFRYPL